MNLIKTKNEKVLHGIFSFAVNNRWVWLEIRESTLKHPGINYREMKMLPKVTLLSSTNFHGSYVRYYLHHAKNKHERQKKLSMNE